MNIQPINNSISMQGNPNKKNWKAIADRVVQKALDAAPSHTAKESPEKLKSWDKINNYISKPMQNRGIMGITALLTQPFIDATNPKVDKETRKMSFYNRIAYILSGTLVGMFIVRGPVYKGIEKMTNVHGTSKYAKALLPKNSLHEITANEKFLKNYRSALAMVVVLGVNSITNFAFDAPLTIFLTNLFNKMTNSKAPESNSTEKEATNGMPESKPEEGEV